MNGMQDLGFEFHEEAALPRRVRDELEAEARRRIQALADGHTDIISVSVAVEELTGDETPHVYQVRTVVYARPENIVAVKKQATVEGALKDALEAVERQVRERRAKLRETWKKP